MAVLGTEVLTLADHAKRLDPDGKIAAIVEMLKQNNEILDDMVFVEGNLPTGHKTTVRAGLPEAAWRMLNYGVPKSKSTTVQVEDHTGMLEAYAEVDKDLADLNGNTAAFRLSEDQAFIEAIGQQHARALFYGDTSKNAAGILGLSARYVDKAAPNGINILDAGGTGSELCSIWLINWGNNTVHGIYPKGSKAGLQHKDLGEVTLQDADGGQYQGYRTHYQLKTGLVVRDHRHVVRIANIPAKLLTSAKLIDLMSEATELLPATTGKPAFYMRREVRTALRQQIRDKNNIHLSLDEAAGRKVLSFDGVPVRRVDVLNLTESKI